MSSFPKWKHSFHSDYETIEGLLSIIEERNIGAINGYILWRATDQGAKFWSDVYHGYIPINEFVIEILDGMLLELGYERKEYDTEI